MFPVVTKRNGSQAVFSSEKIESALKRCFNSIDVTPQHGIDSIVEAVVNTIAVDYSDNISVENIQDIVEKTLQHHGEFDAAKQYILYRAKHAEERNARPIPEEVRKAFAESDAYFPTPIQKFQFFDKYSRFNYDLGRRETWVETVDRSVNYLYDLAGNRLDSSVYERIRGAILRMESMPSMRLLAMA